MSLFFYLFTLAINFWHRKFVTADVTAVLSTINMILIDKDKILIKILYLKGCTAKRLTDEFPEKSLAKCGVNKLFKKLRYTGTGGQAEADRAVPALKKTLSLILLQKFPQSATDFVLPIVR